MVAFAVGLAFVGGCESKPAKEEQKPQKHYRGMGSVCEELSDEDQQFAAKLRPYNRTVYCKQLTPEEREQAKTLSGHDDFDHGRGRKMSPDEAVESLIRKQSPKGRYRRSCRDG